MADRDREGAGTFWILLMVSAVTSAASVPYLLAIVSQMPGASDRALAAPGERLYLFSIAQSLLFTVPTAAVGLLLAPRLGLGMVTSPLRMALPRGALIGLALGVALLAGSALAAGHLPQVQFQPPPWWKGLLASISAGINEEIWLRLGVMTALAAGGRALFARSTPRVSPESSVDAGDPSPDAFEASVPDLPDAAEDRARATVPGWIVWSANVIAALLFGAMHLPQADSLVGLTPAVVAYTLLGNGIAGTVFGWLYWKHGLVSAMAAHFSTDLVLHVIAPVAQP
jgi:hypothetical protein